MSRRLKTLATLAALGILPFTALAAGDKAGGGYTSPAQPSSAAGANASSDGGAQAMFKSLDRNADGSLSKDEVRGTPHEKDFAALDKDGDGKLSRGEHAAAREHTGMAPASQKAAK